MTASRAPERRQHNQGNPQGVERRRNLRDRRDEENHLYVTFRLHETAFLLDIRHVREVLRAQAMTHVPLAHELLAGLINLRGEIVPAIDLRPLFGAARTERETDMLVVVHGDESPFALIADEVHDILPLSPTVLLPPPVNLPPFLKTLTDGVCKFPDALLLSLDVAGVTRIVETHSQR